MANNDLKTQLFYDGEWHDAPTYARDPVTVIRGRGDEQGEAVPSRLSATLDNRGGEFNPATPTSPLYGVAGRNTPIRVTVDGVTRWQGEVAQWSPDRSVGFDPDVGRGDAWCEIAGAGILRRLGQGTPPALSSLTRWYSTVTPAPLAWWPLEHGSALSRTPGVSPLQITMTPWGLGSREPIASYASGEVVGTSDLVDLSDGHRLDGVIPGHSESHYYSAQWLGQYAAGLPDAVSRKAVRLIFDGGGISRVEMQVDSAGNPFVWIANIDDSNGDKGTDTSRMVLDNVQRHYRVDVFDEGTPVTTTAVFTIDGNYAASVSFIGAMGSLIGVSLNYVGNALPTIPRVGQLAIYDQALPPPADAAAGWPDETAGTRFLRLCSFDDVPATLVGDVADTPLMGPQPADTLTNLLAEVERTDGGLLFEPRDQLGLAYRARTSLYAQEPKLILDWAQGQVAQPLQPTLDDQATRNDITATRRNGSSARATLDTGPMSTLPPPDGVGRVETEIRVNPATDDMLPGLASWALHLGTVEDVRWPQVTVDLDASPELAVAASAVDIGDLIRIVNTPLDVSPDDIDLIVLGYTETIEPRRRRITFNCRPGAPWRVGRWGQSRADSATSVLAADVDATQTSLPVSVTTTATWTTRAASWPFDITAGGERMTVTAVTAPAAGIQTMTVTRSVNGVAKPHVTGTPVRLWGPHRWAL